MQGGGATSLGDYIAALQALHPTGAVWPREADAALSRVIAGLAAPIYRVRERGRALLADSFPATAYELLPEWEASVGLPDSCSGLAPTLQGRRRQVVARLTGLGGQSVPYFTAQAAALGYPVTIREYRPARMGVMRLGERMQDEAWAHAWAVMTSSTHAVEFRLGSSGFGERFRSFGAADLECRLRALAPAHTVLIFQYS